MVVVLALIGVVAAGAAILRFRQIRRRPADPRHAAGGTATPRSYDSAFILFLAIYVLTTMVRTWSDWDLEPLLPILAAALVGIVAESVGERRHGGWVWAFVALTGVALALTI
ncbi:MAG TPA: hypothetical protein VGC57_10965 [Cellulomonas sp.]